MIPWDEFKTPQDAYEWAKKNHRKLMFFCNPYCRTVWTITKGFGIHTTDCVLPVRR